MPYLHVPISPAAARRAEAHISEKLPPMTAALPTPARLLASARWPFPREDMTEPGLVVWRLAEDMADLFDAGKDCEIETLVALGWPRPLVAQYVEPARQHSAALIAEKLFERRRREQALFTAAPIPLEPRDADDKAANDRAANDNARGRCEPEVSRSGRGACFDELRAFALGMIGGTLVAVLTLRLMETLP